VANVRERLEVSKQTMHRVHMERFNLKKLNEVEGKALIDASKEVGLEVNTEKTKYMLPSCHQNAGQNHNDRKHMFLKTDCSSYCGISLLSTSYKILSNILLSLRSYIIEIIGYYQYGF
jgi:hypothetical protein